MKTPLLSVCLITYNHKKYIRQAIEGVLMQKVDFEWELIIADDFSTDGTREIVLEYKEKYPCFIKLILQENNVGAAKNWMDLISAPKSKYIAYFEGDDYWTNPLKLQKQLNFLEANSDYVLCFHQVNILKTDGAITGDLITKVPENYETIETLARLGNYIHTPSVVFRNVIKELPHEFKQSPIGDYFLYMILAEQGKLKYMDEKMAVYREGVGIWSGKSEYFRNLNTALLHTYLFAYFLQKENDLILGILQDRIKNFVTDFKNHITKEDLTKLSSNETIKSSIFGLLLINSEELKKEVVYNKTTTELIQIILLRIEKKIWKKKVL
jgi:glycosyltransferase involved in cell wall biosynthesis